MKETRFVRFTHAVEEPSWAELAREEEGARDVRRMRWILKRFADLCKRAGGEASPTYPLRLTCKFPRPASVTMVEKGNIFRIGINGAWLEFSTKDLPLSREIGASSIREEEPMRLRELKFGWPSERVTTERLLAVGDVKNVDINISWPDKLRINLY